MLTDASGAERKGISTDMLCEVDIPHCPVWFTPTGIDCWLLAHCGRTGRHPGMSAREQETILALMLAGF